MNDIEQPGYMPRREHHFLQSGNVGEIDSGQSLLDLAAERGADFGVSYLDASYLSPATGCLVVPKVESGGHKGEPQNSFVVREDTNKPLGLHSYRYPRTDGYMPVFRTAEQLFPGTADSLTLFGEGEKVVFGQNIGDAVDLGGGDILKPMLYWTSSLNGQWATAVFNVMDRLFCQNQLVGATPIIKVRHTINHDQLLDMRSRILSEQVKRAETFARMALTLKDRQYTDDEFHSLTHELVPDPEEVEPSRTKMNNCLRKRGAMTNRWRNERDEWGPTRWAAYNAVQGAEQHRINARTRGHRYDPTRALQRAMEGKAVLAEEALKLLIAA